MGFFSNLVANCADELLIKLSKYREFPEEQYAVSIENRKLKEELATIKSSRYDELLEENKRIRNEIDEMRKERISQLEIENKVLKIELTNSSHISNTSKLLLGVAEQSQIDPSGIEKFLYVNGIFKYKELDMSMQTTELSNKEFQDIVARIFPEGDLSFTGETIHIQISNYDGSYISHFVVDHTKFVNVEEIDDWIEEKTRFRRHSKIDRLNAMEGSWKEWE